MKAPHIPPLKQKSEKEKLIKTPEHPPLHDINVAADPMLAMAKFQGAVIGTYVQKIEHHNINTQNKIKKLKVMLETVSQEKKVAEKQTVLQDEKIKYLKAELVECKEKVKYFKPKNIRQREETKKNQLAISREKEITMEKQITEKQREINQLQETINQNQEDNEKQKKAAIWSNI